MPTRSADDYYALLGVDVNADELQLRRAWRRLAVRWHPDRAGPGATSVFQEILAAYTVLSDPVARAAYDRRRGTSSGRSAGSGAASATSAGGGAPGILLTRLSGPLIALFARGIARQAEEGVIELSLDAREVSQGGMITISMRVPVRCPACGADATRDCARCGNKRAVDEPFSAWLAVAPGIADGTVLLPSALLDGMIRPVSFRVRVRGST